MRQWLYTGLALLVGACATPAPLARNATEPPTWNALSHFNSEAEFRAYVRTLEEVNTARRLAHSGGKQSLAEEPCLTPEDCPIEDAQESVVVTASRVSAPAAASVNTAITNVQTAGVDEGDIVKMIGPYLIVLQDGRLFSINTGASSSDLALTDRINIYRKGGMDAWYDEILVHENRIVATSYNYDHQATEFSVFSLSPEGRFTREGAYFVSSGDYYDSENYATRLVNGNLVIYSPVALEDLDLDANEIEWPRVRRLVRTVDEQEELSTGRPLVDARSIYRPIQRTLDPTFHTIAVCPLGGPRAGDELECRTTAIAGPAPREFYVSNDHLYLWTWAAYEDGFRYDDDAYATECAARPKNSFESAVPSAIFQIDLATGRPRAMFVRGGPNDQLGMEATATQFRALALWVDPRCNGLDEEIPLRFFSTPLADFSTTPETAPESAFTRLPSVMGRAMENHFTAGHLVYGGRTRWSSYMDEDEVAEVTARVMVVPSDNPNAAQVLDAPHNVIRVESIGEDAIITGYHSREALSMSVIDLAGAPRIADTARLAARFETEGRSHAFNYTLAADGSGTLGIPTGEAQWRSGRWVWDSESSDVSFVALSADHRLAPLGELSTKDESEHPSYECEVSCIDWYGNSRPIFVGPRIFALSGTEIIEGRVRSGRIDELARVNLTAPPPRH